MADMDGFYVFPAPDQRANCKVLPGRPEQEAMRGLEQIAGRMATLPRQSCFDHVASISVALP
jgi:hypothetical protein